MAKQIPVANGNHAIVDDEDFERLSKFKWHLNCKRYAYTTVWDGVKSKQYSMHRMVLKCPNGKCPDHINGNGLDNRKSNLRAVTHQENTFNSKSHVDGSSKFKGVCWDKSRRRWYARIFKDGKSTHIGRFICELEAAKAYNEKAKELYGENAHLNQL